MDKIHPKFLRLWILLGRLGHAWRLKTVSLNWQTGSHFSFRKGTEYSRTHAICPLVEPQTQEEQSGFHPDCGTLDQLCTLTRVLEVPGDLEMSKSGISVCGIREGI